MAKDETRAAEEANRLYWSQQGSVGEIANQLGISRRALYELLEPQPAKVSCPQCSTEMVFVNRSALSSGVARCRSCETELAVPAARDQREPAPPQRRGRTNGGGPSGRLSLGSVALIGAVVGAIATLMITRRD